MTQVIATPTTTDEDVEVLARRVVRLREAVHNDSANRGETFLKSLRSRAHFSTAAFRAVPRLEFGVEAAEDSSDFNAVNGFEGVH